MNGSSGPLRIKVEKDDTATSNEKDHPDSAAAVNRKEERPVPVKNERDHSTDSTERISPQKLVEVGVLSHGEFTIKIFTDSEKSKTCPRFFFEPMVVLDPNTVIIQSQRLFKEDVVRFSIQMWNQEIRSKVLELLRLDHPETKEKDVRVMPYEEVQLVYKPESIHQSIEIMEEAIPYQRMNGKLDFFLLCDSPSTAETLADNLRHYPEFVVRKWQLNLECRGLALDSSMTDNKSSSFKFVVSTLPASLASSQERCAKKETTVQPSSVTEPPTTNKQAKDSQEENKNEESATTVPVFSFKGCTNPTGKSTNRMLGFSGSEFRTNAEYGEFNHSKRHFTVMKPGMYQFDFTGHVLVTYGSRRLYRFELQVDSVTKSVCCANSNLMELQEVSLSSRLQLEVGQKVSMIRVSGGLYEAPDVSPTTFSCKFISGN